MERIIDMSFQILKMILPYFVITVLMWIVGSRYPSIMRSISEKVSSFIHRVMDILIPVAHAEAEVDTKPDHEGITTDPSVGMLLLQSVRNLIKRVDRLDSKICELKTVQDNLNYVEEIEETLVETTEMAQQKMIDMNDRIYIMEHDDYPHRFIELERVLDRLEEKVDDIDLEMDDSTKDIIHLSEEMDEIREKVYRLEDRATEEDYEFDDICETMDDVRKNIEEIKNRETTFNDVIIIFLKIIIEMVMHNEMPMNSIDISKAVDTAWINSKNLVRNMNTADVSLDKILCKDGFKGLSSYAIEATLENNAILFDWINNEPASENS